MNNQEVQAILERSIRENTNSLFKLGVLNVSYGSNVAFHGMRNVTFGDDLEVVGDYQVAVGQKVTHPSFDSEEQKTNTAALYEKTLAFYKKLDESGTSPKGFYEESKRVIEIICALVRSAPVPVPPAVAEEATPRVEEVHEPESMRK